MLQFGGISGYAACPCAAENSTFSGMLHALATLPDNCTWLKASCFEEGHACPLG